MKILFIIITAILAVNRPVFSADELYYRQLSTSEKQSLMEQHYREAMTKYEEKDYSKAISHWQEILKIDPDQKAPIKMIEMARKALQDSTKPVEADAQLLYKEGKYQDSLDKVNYLLEIDSSNSKYKLLS